MVRSYGPAAERALNESSAQVSREQFRARPDDQPFARELRRTRMRVRGRDCREQPAVANPRERVVRKYTMRGDRDQLSGARFAIARAAFMSDVPVRIMSS